MGYLEGPQRPGKETMRTRNQRKNKDHLGYITDKKNLGDHLRLTLTLTSMTNQPLELARLTHQE